MVPQQLPQGCVLVAQVPQLQRGALVVLAGHNDLRGHQGVPGQRRGPSACACRTQEWVAGFWGPRQGMGCMTLSAGGLPDRAGP